MNDSCPHCTSDNQVVLNEYESSESKCVVVYDGTMTVPVATYVLCACLDCRKTYIIVTPS